MSDVGIEIHGADELIAKYGRIREQLPASMKRTMVRSVIYAQGQIPAYPAPPAGSSYRRTGTLGRVVTAFPGHSGPRSLGGGGGDNGGTPLTRVEAMGGGVKGVIGGRLSYLPYVIGDDSGGGQAWMHSGRWWILEKVIAGARGGIARLWQSDMKHLFD